MLTTRTTEKGDEVLEITEDEPNVSMRCLKRELDLIH